MPFESSIEVSLLFILYSYFFFFSSKPQTPDQLYSADIHCFFLFVFFQIFLCPSLLSLPFSCLVLIFVLSTSNALLFIYVCIQTFL